MIVSLNTCFVGVFMSNVKDEVAPSGQLEELTPVISHRPFSQECDDAVNG